MALEVANVKVELEGQAVLQSVSFSADDGEVVAVVGASGSGKSTLLYAIAGLLTPSAGTIRVDGKPMAGVPLAQRPTGIAFQTPELFHMSVRDNIEFGLDDAAMREAKRHNLIEVVMASLNIVGLEHRMPESLSGGQAQRVSLARTLVTQPRVLLLDEPLAHIESAVRRSIHADLLALVHRMRITTLYVTHDIDDACMVADRIVVLENGKVAQFGRPEELFSRPASLHVAKLMGVHNALAVQLEPIADSGQAVARAGSQSFLAHVPESLSGDGVALLPPHKIALTTSPATTIYGNTGQILHRYFARSHYVYHVETEHGTLVAWNSQRFEPGDFVDFIVLYAWAIQQ